MTDASKADRLMQGVSPYIAIDGAKVTVTMTLTTPGCPMHESIVRGVQSALLDLEGVEAAEVDLVWDPPWSAARMSEYGRVRAGVFEK